MVLLRNDRVVLARRLSVLEFTRCKQRSASHVASTCCDMRWTRANLPSQALVLDDKCVPYTLRRTNCDQDVPEGESKVFRALHPTRLPRQDYKSLNSMYQDIYIITSLSSVIVEASDLLTHELT